MAGNEQADKTGCYYDRLQTPHNALNTMRGWQAESGFYLTVGPKMPGSILPNVADYDLVIGQRISTSEAVPLWGLLMAEGMPASAYEIDDLLFDVEETNTAAYEYFNQQENKARMASAIFTADAVITSCQPLADELRGLNPNVYVIPNYLPKRYLRPPRKSALDDRVVIGWAGGSSHKEDLESAALGIDKALGELGNERALLHLMGSNYGPVFRCPSSFVPWYQDKSDYLNALDLDIGLCPLRDSRFNRSKTYVKALEYAFKGIPTVASNVTPYKEFVVDGVTGYLVNTNEEWREAIVELARDSKLRKKMGLAAFELAQEHTAEGHRYERAAIYERIITDAPDIKAAKAAFIEDMNAKGADIILAAPN